MAIDIATLIGNAETTRVRERKAKQALDISMLINNAMECGERTGRNGKVITRTLSADELRMEQERTPTAYELGVRHSDVKRWAKPVVIAAGVVRRYILQAKDVVEFANLMTEHYGRYFSEATLCDIVERAWYSNQATHLN